MFIVSANTKQFANICKHFCLLYVKSGFRQKELVKIYVILRPEKI